jgi:hypothetical protein
MANTTIFAKESAGRVRIEELEVWRKSSPTR